MIAKILKTFGGEILSHKIDYQITKIENGVARELYNSIGDSLIDMYRNMSLVASLNDRVKSPYIEFILSSPIGEELSDDKFIEVAKEYLERMGYSDSCYTIIKNDDKDNLHVHILATTVDMNGLWISDSYSKERSGKIMRELELKHGLEIMEKGKSSHNKTLGESQYRQYFFDTALRKALRSRNAKERVKNILGQSENYKTINSDMNKTYTNSEWKVILGDDTYEKLLDMLSQGKFFNPLFKDELLSVMDKLISNCNTVNDFRNKLREENYYMRLVSDKGKSYYVYGIPERGFYIKDKALPARYRFGTIKFSGHQMTSDEQKHYLYNKIFATLNASSSYEDFKSKLNDNSIQVIEHTNKKGTYGFSFSMTDVETPVSFKGADISRRLTYQNIHEYFFKGEGNNKELKGTHTPIEPVIICYMNTKQEWESELSYMAPSTILFTAALPFDNEPNKRRKTDDELSIRKKKRKNKGLSI